MKILSILSIAMLLNSCAYFNLCESIEQGELRIEVPNRDERSLPDLCRSYYNDGTGQWAECMGVELK